MQKFFKNFVIQVQIPYKQPQLEISFTRMVSSGNETMICHPRDIKKKAIKKMGLVLFPFRC